MQDQTAAGAAGRRKRLAITQEGIVVARLTGMPVRPVTVAQYVISGLVAYLAGLVIVASNSGLNTRLYNSTLVYDVLLVGTLFSGMTIMNLSCTTRNPIKSLVLLAALIAETLINPRDGQTPQQGDI
ncbi:hypothetical protein [Ruixingdingia sedimenti]|uniref:Uncharacterized protein n=1 Tax=Ruixingdingia sedimenti TaxID=3073604 RepID=A0ABU1F8Z8_9RHOB|nr:hypothetical protein [Xinfangfangia sp. LG-4]MDR5653309.1 hypothetical protein [Xinfangfangia sp. LG-4]